MLTAIVTCCTRAVNVESLLPWVRILPGESRVCTGMEEYDEKIICGFQSTSGLWARFSNADPTNVQSGGRCRKRGRRLAPFLYCGRIHPFL